MKHDTFALLVAHYGQAVIYRTPEVGRIERDVIAAYDRLNAENERLRGALEDACLEKAAYGIQPPAKNPTPRSARDCALAG